MVPSGAWVAEATTPGPGVSATAACTAVAPVGCVKEPGAMVYDITASSPGASVGILAVAPSASWLQSFGVSQCMKHVGAGQSDFAQLQVHTGLSQTLWQGCTPCWYSGAGQASLHTGVAQVAWQAGQFCFSQPCVSGHWTLHCGWLHCLVHSEVSVAEHLVSHLGAEQLGVQVWGHWGLSQVHLHSGVQPPSGTTTVPFV